MTTSEESPEQQSGEPRLEADPEPPPLPARRLRKSHAFLGAAVLGVAAIGFNVSKDDGARVENEPTSNDAPELDGAYIRFSDAYRSRIKLTSELPRVDPVAPAIKVTGTVIYDPRRFAAVGTRTIGRVDRILKFIGDEVKAGDLLAVLESAEVGRAESLVLAARAKELAAETDMKREQRLADARITAVRDAEFAKAAYEASRAERIAAERSVHALGGDLDAELGKVALRAPIAGRIVAANVARGQTVEPSDTLFEVADLSVLWVGLKVFERDIASVRPDDRVEIALQSANGPTLTGSVAHVGDVIDVNTRTADVRVVVKNPNRQLRPGQSVVAHLFTAARSTRALSIPRRALTRIDGKPTVFVLHDKNSVEPRTVVVGPEDLERAAILDGLKESEAVVLDGMFALKSEIFR